MEADAERGSVTQDALEPPSRGSAPLPGVVDGKGSATQGIGSKPVSNRIFMVSYVLMLLLVAFGAIVEIGIYRDHQERESWVAHTSDVQTELFRLSTLLQEAESATRAFIITSRQESFDRSQRSREGTMNCWDRVATLTRDNPAQQARSGELKGLLEERFGIMKQLMKMHREGGFKQDEQAALLGQGTDLTDKIREVINRMAVEEERLLKEREAVSGTSLRRAVFSTYANFTLITLLFTVILVLQLQQGRSRRIIDETLERTASYTRSLIEASLDPLVTISAEGKITDVNAASVRITGRTREELLGTDFSDYFTEPERARAGYQRVFAEGMVRDYPLSVRRADGAVTDVLYNASLYRDGQGRVQGVFAAARDITERKKTEVMASRLVAIVESSEDAIIGMDIDGVVTSWNRGAEVMFGWTRNEMLGLPMLHVIPKDRHDEEQHILERIHAGESIKHFETQRIRKDGEVLDVSVTASPIRNEAGQVIGISKVARDITDRKKVEQEILELNADLERRVRERTMALSVVEERMRLAAETAEVGFWDWDLETNRIVWDGPMFRIYGMPERVDGIAEYKDWSSRVHPEDFAKTEEILLQTVRQAGRGQRVFRIIRDSDHSVRTIQASDATIKGEDGTVKRVVGINMDITEQLHRLEEIRTLNAELANRAAQLEVSVKELDAFSYSVSHDLRAPLRAIDGFSRILEEDYAPKLDEEGKHTIGVIRGEAQRMGHLIDDLLSFSRLGRQQLESSEIDMEGMARRVFEELLAREPGRAIRFTLHPIPPAYGSEAMIRQVWINLIGNAVKFTGKHEAAEVEIGVTTGESGEQAYFVRDNGAGFDMRYADKLFGVFQRLHSAEEFPGTGVGLALVQRIVSRHGGRIWGEGQVDHGATFHFTLPDPRRIAAGIPAASPQQTS